MLSKSYKNFNKAQILYVTEFFLPNYLFMLGLALAKRMPRQPEISLHETVIIYGKNVSVRKR